MRPAGNGNTPMVQGGVVIFDRGDEREEWYGSWARTVEAVGAWLQHGYVVTVREHPAERGYLVAVR